MRHALQGSGPGLLGDGGQAGPRLARELSEAERAEIDDIYHIYLYIYTLFVHTHTYIYSYIWVVRAVYPI